MRRHQLSSETYVTSDDRFVFGEENWNRSSSFFVKSDICEERENALIIIASRVPRETSVTGAISVYERHQEITPITIFILLGLNYSVKRYLYQFIVSLNSCIPARRKKLANPSKLLNH